MSTWTKSRSELATLAKTHDKSDPVMIAKRAELRALKLEDHIRRVLDEAPPMSDERRRRIAALLLAGN